MRLKALTASGPKTAIEGWGVRKLEAVQPTVNHSLNLAKSFSWPMTMRRSPGRI